MGEMKLHCAFVRSGTMGRNKVCSFDRSTNVDENKLKHSRKIFKIVGNTAVFLPVTHYSSSQTKYNGYIVEQKKLHYSLCFYI
jgi:hypothetical protein